MIAMVLCWGIGRAVGSVAQTALDHQLEVYRQEHPLPKLIVQQDDTDGATAEQGEALTA